MDHKLVESLEPQKNKRSQRKIILRAGVALGEEGCSQPRANKLVELK